MKALVLAVLSVASLACTAQSHYRQGYVTKNGTYVAPSYATNPNNTLLDNYSTKGNVNPYTGKAGTVDPYKHPAPNTYVAPETRYEPSTLYLKPQRPIGF